MMKGLIRTKTFWGGLAAIATGVGLILTGDPANGINAVVSGFLAIFVRDGILKVQPIAHENSSPRPVQTGSDQNADG